MMPPGAMMTAMTPLGVYGSGLLPSFVTVPALWRRVMVPRVSLLRHRVSPGDAQVVRVLYLKLLDTAYHSRSPSPSRRSGRPRDFHGSRPRRRAWLLPA